jgi:hypothetical protein
MACNLPEWPRMAWCLLSQKINCANLSFSSDCSTSTSLQASRQHTQLCAGQSKDPCKRHETGGCNGIILVSLKRKRVKVTPPASEHPGFEPPTRPSALNPDTSVWGLPASVAESVTLRHVRGYGGVVRFPLWHAWKSPTLGALVQSRGRCLCLSMADFRCNIFPCARELAALCWKPSQYPDTQCTHIIYKPYTLGSESYMLPGLLMHEE